MNDRNAKIAELRKRAEMSLRSGRFPMEQAQVSDMHNLIEELQIHQVELEMQNEELRSSQVELEQSRKKYSDLYDFAPVGYLTLNEEGRIVEANLTASRLLGIERSTLVGKPFSLYVAEKYRAELHLHLRKALRTQEPQTCEIKLDGKGLTDSCVQIDSTYLMDSNGQHLTRTTMTDITDRKSAEEKLEIFSAQLERSNQELEQFAFIASHDLQEPLRKIHAFGDLLEKKSGDKLSAEGKDFLLRMQDAAKRMQQLIGDLLKYSRIAVQPEPLGTVDCRAAVMKVISDLEPRIERFGANVEVFELPVLRAQKTQIHQLFQNLLVNALKFHGEKQPHIRIYSRRTDHEYLIFVEDNGIGFDEMYLDRIFVPFQRLHGRSAFEGTGMGLAICRKILERHGGSITAKSKPGEGSTFIITLPV